MVCVRSRVRAGGASSKSEDPPSRSGGNKLPDENSTSCFSAVRLVLAGPTTNAEKVNSPTRIPLYDFYAVRFVLAGPT